MSARCHARSALLGFLVVLGGVAAACGSAPGAPQVPAGPGKPVAAAPAHPPDLTAVPAPPSLIVSGRLTKLSASLAIAHELTKLPMPRSEQLTEIVAGDSVGPLLDVDQPVDFAVASPGEAALARGALTPLMAVSAAVRDPDAARAALAERYKLVPGENGAWLIQGLGQGPASVDPQDDEDRGKSDSADGHACELAPASGAAPIRLVCGAPKALSVLGPWLTRTAARFTSAADLHVDLRMEPLHSILSAPAQKSILSILVGSALSEVPGASAARDVARSLAADLVDFVLDLDSVALDLQLSATGGSATSTLKVSGTSSVLGRLAAAHADRNGPPSAAFWQMPADADFAFFDRGIDAPELSRARDLVLEIVKGSLAEDGVKDADRKPIVDAVGKLASSAPMAYASGLDVDVARKSLTTALSLGQESGGASPTPSERGRNLDAAERVAFEDLLGWHLVEVDEVADRFAAAAREVVAGWSRPGVAAGYRAKGTNAPPPTIRVAAIPKTAPKGAVHYVVELHAAFERGAGARSGPAKSKRMNLGPAKPLAIHFFLVPDGERTWLGVGGNEALVVSKLGQAMSPAGDKLGARAELAALKDTSVGAAGFVTARAIPETDPVAMLFGGTRWRADEQFEEIAQLPNRGASPVLFSVTAQPVPVGAPAAIAMTLQVPRGTIEDAIVTILHHGGI